MANNSSELGGTDDNTPDSEEAIIKCIESNIETKKDLALLRIRWLGQGKSVGDNAHSENDDDTSNCLNSVNSGIPSVFVPILRRSINELLQTLKNFDPKASTLPRLSDHAAIQHLQRLLRVYQQMASLDVTLNEELGREGAHRCLSQVIKLDVSTITYPADPSLEEENQDTIMELQDLACEIASYCKSFPLAVTPLTREELIARLPLVFKMIPSVKEKEERIHHDHSAVEILIHQVTARQSAQKDVGFVMWPSAVALSQWIVNDPDIIHDKSVLELGAGCGLVGLLVAKMQLQQAQKKSSSSSLQPVTLSDFNETVVDNLTRNLELNGLHGMGSAVGLDFFQQEPINTGCKTMGGGIIPQVDVVLASDVICQPEDAFAVANTIASALKIGGKAIMISADSKHRFGVECFEKACQEVTCLTFSSQNVDHIYKGILSSMAMTSGYVEGMSLTMYTMTKTALA